MNQSGRHQGGWVASFVIVGAVLVLALIGGVYYLKTHQGMFAGTGNDQQTDQVTTSDKPTSAPDSSDSTDSHNENSTDTSKSDDSTKSSDDSTTKSSDSKTDDDANLPETGPADVAMHIAVIGLVTFVAASYIASRRAVSSL